MPVTPKDIICREGMHKQRWHNHVRYKALQMMYFMCERCVLQFILISILFTSMSFEYEGGSQNFMEDNT